MSQTILAVDDDEGLLRLVRLQLFQEVNPELVSLDVGLPALDGLSVCRRIRSLGEVPILMLSAFCQGKRPDRGAGGGGR